MTISLNLCWLESESIMASTLCVQTSGKTKLKNKSVLGNGSANFR